MTSVVIYTDGACKGNPGPGGWAAILTANGKEKVICGGCKDTTNNKMELTAVIEGLKALKRPCDITIVTDSTYVMMTEDKWEKWQNKARLPNRELWETFVRVWKDGGHSISWQKVVGHSGHPMNERCDRLASEQAVKYCHVAAGTNTLTINEALKILNARK